MTKILVMPSDNNIEKLKETDGYLLSLQGWSVNSPYKVTLEEIKNIKNEMKSKEIFVSLNKNIYSSEIESLKNILKEIETLELAGIFYADTCFIQLKKELHLKTPLIWSQEHLTTNYETINFWNQYGVSGVYLSPEITLKEIEEIKNHTSSTLIVPIFGYLPMFTSKRHEIKNYFNHFQIQDSSSVYYIEKENKSYPIIDEEDGTTAYTAFILNGFEEYLKLNVDYVTLNSFDIDSEVFLKILNIYKNKNIEEAKKIEQWLSNLDKGFLYKETIYKIK